VTLTAFPNTALADPTIEDRRDAHPDTLRRAVAFIDEHAHTGITSADIADPATTTITAVAYRWGFPSASRFTVYYRQAYGIQPSTTLRRG